MTVSECVRMQQWSSALPRRKAIDSILSFPIIIDVLWSEEKLAALQFGDVVWYKFRDYPFWPASVRLC
jgi:hypothetical protein